MDTSIPATYLQLVRTAWVHIGSGALWRLMRLRKGPVLAALYPVFLLVLQLVLAILAGRLVSGSLDLLPYILGPNPAPALEAIKPFVWGVTAVWALRWFKKKDGKFFAYYLMHEYAFGAATLGANTPVLEARMVVFGDAIAEALASDVDEVLVVGHSSGAHLGVSVLADLIRAGRVPSGGPALAFRSLGQVVPMVSFLKNAHRLRADLAYLSTQHTAHSTQHTAHRTR